MYFQIDNTPERIRKARRMSHNPKESPKEETPRLILAPFSRPPQVVFDDVPVGSSCERSFEMFNPLKQLQQITLSKDLPPGLNIPLPGEWLELEPETCYCLTMQWTPIQPTAMRETIRFTDKNRGRFDVIVVLKTVLNVKASKTQAKGFKTSPGKKKKKPFKKSPVAIFKKKSEIIYNTVKVKKSINEVQSPHQVDFSMDEYQKRCPFDSTSNIDVNISEIFSNVGKTNVMQETYDKSKNIYKKNILRPSNNQNCFTTVTDFCDNLAFSPLKTLPIIKIDKLDEERKINVNSNTDFYDDLDVMTFDKENQTHSIISVTSSQPPDKWITKKHTDIENRFLATQTVLPMIQPEMESNQFMETPRIKNKQPNTSSPKELSSPNFSINTDVSRISDLSFFPQRFSTEKKLFPKVNETQELFGDRLNSDTFTKGSPINPVEGNNCHMNMERPPHYFDKDQPKVCRQSLFREYQIQKEMYDRYPSEQNRVDVKSPLQSQSPPLKSIPEESIQLSDTQVFDKTSKHLATFTINRTFDRPHESSLSTSTKQTWSKKAIRVEPDLWKVPGDYIKKHTKSKPAAVVSKDISCTKKVNTTLKGNNSINQNITATHIGNVYTQSSTVDPFTSATYFYDEDAVHKFENEFKKWLNCILTPPADLDSNVEQKIDVGKAWLENRNKEVPLAPTKEQVSSTYHNSQRLESLRRSAKNLLLSPDIVQVFQKLNIQIERKLIAIRIDRNLHLDIGLQKTIMGLLLSYNPLWLRIGLEAIYGVVLPLKSNSDIEGLTTFIIQRMFKNPFLKNKHSKSSAPNMLLPAYMEAIKKYTLKKFFMLVFFLDQGKQRKLIAHDPCLFCRNAICKESREILIRFTREVIAGIGDITKHLRPLGYIVCHKQSYLDEYKYAVYNLALDIRDGVRLTKVMEIILMKKGLVHQLRTPAISRLQKIHNVQVAMNALKEANFVINGDITPTDIADGHREKTLSLLWQIIRVFRAPLFEKAANVIQIWWRKKYEIIVEKRKEEERIRNKLIDAASAIQNWWRKIQYNRQVEWRMQQITRATITVQKYCRMWLCKTRLQRYKTSVIKIEDWYKSVQLMRHAQGTLIRLRFEREQLRHKSATVIQRIYRSIISMRKEKNTYLKLKNAALRIQRQFRAQVQMRKCKESYTKLLTAILVIQRRYRALLKMREQKSRYLALKSSCIKIQNAFRANILGKQQRRNFLKQKEAAITIQNWYRNCRKGKEIKQQFEVTKQACVTLQRYFKAYIIGRTVRQELIRTRTATICIQRFYRSYLNMRKIRQEYIKIKKATVTIQKFYRLYVETKKQREKYIKFKSAVRTIEKAYKRYKQYQNIRQSYLQLREATVHIQRVYRGKIAMRLQRNAFLKIKESVIKIQQKYRALILMRTQRESYTTLRSTVINMQIRYKAQSLMKQERLKYLKIQKATVTIQRFYRAYILGTRTRHAYLSLKNSTIIIQRRYKALLAIIRKNEAAKKIQTWYKSIRQRDTCRKEFLATLKRVTTVQAVIRMYLVRKQFVKLKAATLTIQRYYRSYRSMIQQRQRYLHVRQLIIMLQSCVRSCIIRKSYLRLQAAVSTIQIAYKLKRQRDLLKARKENAAIVLQKYTRRYLVQSWFKRYRQKVLYLQEIWKGKLLTRVLRCEYLQKKKLVIKLQSLARGYLVRKKVQINKQYMLQMREEQRQNRAALKIQALVRGHQVRKQNNDDRVTTLRRRWREGALHSTEPTLKERNDEAIELLRNAPSIVIVIDAFQALEFLSEAMPTFYNLNASKIVNRLIGYMMVANRSISSIQVLTSGAAILVNLARYKVTGPQIYEKQYIFYILKWMLRFTSSETLLFCKLATYLWLGAKYDGVREQLQELLHTQENHKTMITIKSNADRMKRMARNKNIPQPRKFNSNLKSTCSSAYVMPALEPDYGLVRVDNPRYFEDPQQAIDCLFHTYNL